MAGTATKGNPIREISLMRLLSIPLISMCGGWLLLASAAMAVESSAWKTCVGIATSPDDKVTACTAAIDAKTETGNRLAAAYCNRGYGLTEKRDLDRALADLDEAIRIDPAYACAYTNRGRVYAFKKDLDRAIKDYDEAIRIDPGFALAYNNRGDAWSNKGDARRALADFDAAIKADPDLAIAFGNRGFLYYRMHDFAHAIQDYTHEIKLSPDALAYINRGNAFRDADQLDRAMEDYGEVTRIAPEDARGWRNRGLMRLFKGDNKGGVADYDKALQYDPSDAYSWNNRGMAKKHLGDKKGAIADFRKALALQPNLQSARDGLQAMGVAK